ncbi:MAG: FMN-binding protein [Spirochaetales bacterium]|nr:FMN-binding protein [Spirochaetales bacterium]
MPKPLRIILITLGSIVFLGLILFIVGTIGMNDVKEFDIPDIDLNSIDDGEYEGACTISRWAMKVKVMIQDHKIKSVTIVDKMMSNLNGQLIARINGNVIDKQAPDFDAVSGASITSKAYLIAITDALQRGMK